MTKSIGALPPRLYDAIAATDPNISREWLDPEISMPQILFGHKRELDDMPEAAVIVANNVAEHLNAESTQEEWDVRTDFPILAPPIEVYWRECRRPSRILNNDGEVSLWQGDWHVLEASTCMGAMR